MIEVQKDFRKRVIEIESYLAFVQQIDAGHALLVQRDGLTPVYTLQQRDDLLRTFKASAFLLLYNLMESTVSNAVEAIFDEFVSQGTSFDSCRREVRLVVLNNLKQHNIDKILPSLNRLVTDVIKETFQKSRVVSGNVDALKIRVVADSYGFARPTVDGDDLLVVKCSRNDLAHGSKSFAEVGRDFALSRIVEIKDKVVAYLGAMLVNVAAYITQQHYLAGPGRP